MRHCLACQTDYSADTSQCPSCQYKPAVLDGFEAFAPDLAHANEGFKADYFAELAALEANNFWFKARNQLILWALSTYAPDFKSYFEIGCGTGFVLSGIAKAYPSARLGGSEIFTSGLSEAAKRLPTTTLMQMDARSIPFKNEFDVIGSFDVLEHIKEDEQVLRQIHQALKPGGIALLSVPQHPWLWSKADDYACHVRRYTRNELHQKMEAAGFRMIRSTSFVSLLLPAMILSRFVAKKSSAEQYDAAAELRLSPFINTLFLWVLSLELAAIKNGVNFIAGGSRLVIAKKI